MNKMDPNYCPNCGKIVENRNEHMTKKHQEVSYQEFPDGKQYWKVIKK